LNTLIADGHVHLYPCYDLGALFRTACANLSLAVRQSAASNPLLALFLAESRDCHVFRDLAERRGVQGTDLVVEETPDAEAVVVRGGECLALHVFAGRQVVTRERLEVLALAADAEFPEGEPARAVVERIRSLGGVPVLSWAPGKWFFARKAVVRDLLAAFPPDVLLLGDTSLRPASWPEPVLMRQARRKGTRVIAGSDPLRFPGEERQAGRYGFVWHGEFDLARPVASARAALLHSGSPPARFGARSGIVETLWRLVRHAQAKRAPARRG
jgi:hypothetical protein